MYKPRQQNHSNRRGFTPRKMTVRSFDPRTIIAKTVASANPTQEILTSKHKFTDFPLNERLAQNVANRKFTAPTPIQDQAIPEILAGRDVVGVANTGTGKTAAFLIPLINKVSKNQSSRVLIIAPTRELAVQINKEFQDYAQGMGLYSATLIGGVSVRNQIDRLHRGPQFIIGTPGRLLDLENQRKLDLSKFDSIVLDEVDRMLDMGFIDDITLIIDKIPKTRQSLFFSATLDTKVRSVMSKFIVNPVMIIVKTADFSTNVTQGIIELKGRNKADVLCELLRKNDVTKTLVFMRTKRSADSLQKSLQTSGLDSTVLHGNKTQKQRQKSLDLFRQGRVNVLIATDVASRGIDVEDISHVINHDLPESYEAYIHRIGRTGRANKKGIALTFIG